MAFQSFLPHLLLLVPLLSCFISSSEAYKFYVGGREGWVSKPSENNKYNQWAERNRFQVNDTIYFKYTKGLDSVLVVNKDDYEKCNTKNPIKKYEDGNSEFKFDRSGPFYFISGKNCNEGQKLIVVVLAIRPKPGSTPPPAPGAHPPAASPPSGPRPISPFPSPTTAPVSAPSPKSPAPPSQAPTSSPTLAPSSPSPTSQAPTGSPVQTPTSSPSPTSQAPTGSPVQTPSTSPSPASESPAPSTYSPINSPAGAPSPYSASPTSLVPSPSPASTVPASSPVPFANSPAETPSVSPPSPTSLSPEQPTPTPAGSGSSPGSSPEASNQVSPPGKAIAATILPSSLLVSCFTILFAVALLHKY